MNAKTRAVLERIGNIEAAISRAIEYLESGKHARWNGFRPHFAGKTRDGMELPPHKDWVRNVFLAGQKKALNQAESLLEELNQAAVDMAVELRRPKFHSSRR